ncbi:uncharacterized protein LOC121600434 [Anopheles merus]|uniref:uncharacterized protein LOC121600434 n=1 Tax=Anopheles merus TaxID=30066 RepID=UPI001BE45D01|nr:uncharacterized protein LOC121600434 [Anopheles merus]
MLATGWSRSSEKKHPHGSMASETAEHPKLSHPKPQRLLDCGLLVSSTHVFLGTATKFRFSDLPASLASQFLPSWRDNRFLYPARDRNQASCTCTTDSPPPNNNFDLALERWIKSNEKRKKQNNRQERKKKTRSR